MRKIIAGTFALGLVGLALLLTVIPSAPFTGQGIPPLCRGVGGNDFYVSGLIGQGYANNNSTVITNYAGTTNVFTANGNAKNSTTQAKWNATALSFDNSISSNITTPNNTNIQLTGDFTIDYWIYLNSTAGAQTVLGKNNSTALAPQEILIIAGAAALYSSSNGSTFDIANGQALGTVSATTWTYHAISRTGSTYSLYQNTTRTSTFTSSATPMTSTDQMTIGTALSGAVQVNPLNGYLQSLRLTKGLGRYSGATIEVPAGPPCP